MTNLNPLPWVFDQQLPASLHTPLQLSRLTLSLLFRPNIPSPNRTQISKEEPGAAISHLVDCLSSQSSQMVGIGLTLFHHKDVDSPWYRVIAFLPMHSNSRWKPIQTNVYCLHFWNICTDHVSLLLATFSTELVKTANHEIKRPVLQSINYNAS